MEITVSTQEGIAVVAPSGVIDARGALTFESTLMEVLAANTRLIVVDLLKVDLMTSAGIRVLVKTVKRLGGDGTLLLCGLSAQVKSVFDIAGLTSYFGIKSTVAEALAAHKPSRPATAGPSRISRLTMRLLGDGTELGLPAAAAAEDAHPPSRLTAQVTAVLKDVR